MLVRPLWEDLRQCSTPLLLIVGEKDGKFKRIAQEMCYEIGHGTSNGDDSRKEIYEIVEVPNCGHAAHLENPLPIIRALRRFLTGLENSSTPNERAVPFHGS
ncbi:Protein PHYLLO, chloroplastic [Vitis vinifera]|uniref:Protein PHYLLO, chloroplastic n=1 Tax=Vitis vinifera TaxID=29760 RepID=A0A438JBF4_VITVI|nr:Protein PHYLLO, chloroplastic [Vitis vinifera]